MTIPQDAVEAAAIIVSGDTEKWFYEYPTSDSDRAGYRAKAHKALAAALPAIEQQIRAQVAQEILDAKGTDEWPTPEDAGLELAANIALEKAQP